MMQHAYTSQRSNPSVKFLQQRRMLCEDVGYFGAGPFEEQLDRSYASYVAFCRDHRIKQSQPPFTVKLAALAMLCLVFGL